MQQTRRDHVKGKVSDWTAVGEGNVSRWKPSSCKRDSVLNPQKSYSQDAHQPVAVIWQLLRHHRLPRQIRQRLWVFADFSEDCLCRIIRQEQGHRTADEFHWIAVKLNHYPSLKICIRCCNKNKFFLKFSHFLIDNQPKNHRQIFTKFSRLKHKKKSTWEDVVGRMGEKTSINLHWRKNKMPLSYHTVNINICRQSLIARHRSDSDFGSRWLQLGAASSC